MNEIVTQPTANQALPAAAYLASLKTEVSRRGMVSALNAVAHVLGQSDWRAVDWITLNAANVDAIMAKIKGAPATRNKVLSGIKGVARAAFRLGLLDSETYGRIKDTSGARGSRLPPGREIDSGEVLALIKAYAADKTPAGRRDAAMLALMRATGMRRAEIASMQIRDMDLDTGLIRVVGKGDKERKAYLKNGAARFMRDWLAVRGNHEGPVFCAINKSGVMRSVAGLSTMAVHEILAKRAKQAGITDISAHDFRRMFVGDLLDSGADIATVAKLAGHSSVTTTQRYDRRGDKVAEQAAGFISVPYF